MAGVWRTGVQRALVDTYTRACWDRFFVFASISGYQNVGAATTIAVLVASQLIGGLVLDIFRSHGVPLRALIGPICGAILLVVGARLVARRTF
ncbi:DMT family transporter [Escherichia coli]|nr:DMT family transporter [Escherichia coli]